MNSLEKHNTHANLVGASWMVFSMAAFAIEDVYIKAASTSLPVGQILILFGLGGALLFAVSALIQRQRLFARQIFSGTMLVRFIFEITGRLFFVLAITLTSLSSATVILQATPIMVVAGAALFFGERVGWIRWLAILVGLLGVFIIVNPAQSGFSVLSMLAVIAMIGFAGRDLASRAAPLTIGNSVLGFYGFVAVIVAGIGYHYWEGSAFVVVTTRNTMFMCGAVLCGVAAYTGLMNAMRTGEVAAVTPLRYTRLIFGVFCGVLVFNEQFTQPMLIGSVLIVISGLVVLWRQSKPVAS